MYKKINFIHQLMNSFGMPMFTIRSLAHKNECKFFSILLGHILKNTIFLNIRNINIITLIFSFNILFIFKYPKMTQFLIYLFGFFQ